MATEKKMKLVNFCGKALWGLLFPLSTVHHNVHLKIFLEIQICSITAKTELLDMKFIL